MIGISCCSSYAPCARGAAGQPALGVAHRPLAHQLERHHRHRLLQDQPLEVAQPAGVARGDEPGLRARRGRAATPAAPARGRPAPGGRARTRRLGRAAPAALAAPARTSARTCSSASSGSSRRNASRGDRVARGSRARITAPPIAAGERAHDLVEPALLEHEPLQPLVDRDAALEHLVLLVHQPRERLLGDRDERQLVGHLEQREAERARPPPPSPAGSVVVLEAGAEAEPGQVVVAPAAARTRAGCVVGRRAGCRSSAAARRPTARASGRAAR